MADLRTGTGQGASQWWKKGVFQFLFFSMGQGDCCVVTCPDGKHVMIDCGSKNEESDSSWHNIAEMLRSRDVLGLNDSTKQIDALILTHPDKDHISKVSELLGAERANFTYEGDGSAATGNTGGGSTTGNGDDDPLKQGVKRKRDEVSFKMAPVTKVYFSDPNRTRGDFKSAPLRTYSGVGTNSCADTIYDHLKVQELYCVTLNKTEAKYDKWTKPADTEITDTRRPFIAEDHQEQNITRSGLVVFNGRTDGGKDWSVTIIAGNVPKDLNEVDTSDNDGRNAGSLVTLIKFGVEKFLICGDATVSTERYLIENYPHRADLENLTLIQAPHHGSNTSFSKDFVEGCAFKDKDGVTDIVFGGVKPKRVVISVQLHEHAHHLPASNAMERAKRHAKPCISHNGCASHRIHYWEEVKADEFAKLAQQWKTDKVEYTEEKDNQSRTARYVRRNIAADFSGIIILDGFNTAGNAKKYVLKQELVNKDVLLTGIEAHLWYYFYGTGN